jgi:hypothetical protein
LEDKVPGKQRKEQEISITFFPPYHLTVFSARLAHDADVRGAEAMTRFVVSDGKNDERTFFLASPFFPAKNV